MPGNFLRIGLGRGQNVLVIERLVDLVRSGVSLCLRTSIADCYRDETRLPRGLHLGKNLDYRLQRFRNFWRIKPNCNTAGYVDLIAGFAGVLVRPDWFDEKVFDIPDVMWTVDDPWISGHLERMGIPIWMTGKGYRLPEKGAGKIDSLSKLVQSGCDRVDADLMVIDYFREQYGIWPKSDQPGTIKKLRTKTLAEMARRHKAELTAS
ncbi:hypothetical protein [Brucella anthropi]|uniref:hypothetical protein n=1 Tax=Brucella anthropi TaxID=529 RepID=UPI00235F95F1|nr:hypothetical protein [Brucella anthropi]